MGWDASRPVPWQRMVREWLLYVGIMLVVLVVFFRDEGMIGVIAGLLVSGPLYLGFGYVLAKFGYRRKSWGELREARTKPTAERGGERATAPRPKPAPTSRTGGPSNRPGGARKKR